MFIAKMHTRYPEFHGTGYYNFLMATTEERLEGLIEEQSHDFQYIKTVHIPVENAEDIIDMYPTKQELNEAKF